MMSEEVMITLVEEERRVLSDALGCEISSQRLENEQSLKLFRHLIVILRQGIPKSAIYDLAKRILIEEKFAKCAFLSERVCGQDITDLVKLPDLVANFERNQADLDIIYDIIVKVVVALSRDSSLTDRHCQVLQGLLANFGPEELLLKVLVEQLQESADGVLQNFHRSIIILFDSAKKKLIKSVVYHSNNAEVVERLLGKDLLRNSISLTSSVLFSSVNFTNDCQTRLICCLAKCLDLKDLISLLEKALTLWADPVIAKAYISREVLRWTKVSFIIFFHIDPTILVQNQMKIIEKLVSGLPNHFNSSDGRTVILAKYFSELITETLNHYGKKDHPIPDQIASPDDPLCRELLHCFHRCETSTGFWYQASLNEKMTYLHLKSESIENKEKDDFDSDDDDSDLEPIESLEPPAEKKIKYIRQFLEQAPETKEHKELVKMFSGISDVIRHQLALDHADVGRQLLSYTFLWENEFDDPKLDDLRKMAMITVLETKLEGNVEHVCQLFHGDHVQPYRKNLLLDVLSKSSKSLSLKDLQFLSVCVFSRLLISDDTIAKQDVTVQIPFIMFLSRTICHLPEELVTENMMVSFMRGLSSLKNVDGATEQTICFALNNVMSVVGHKQFSVDANVTMRKTRDWLLAIQANR